MERHLENNREMNTQNKCTVRTRILGIISNNPGICYSGIKEKTGNGNGTVCFHLRVLENTHMVVSRVSGRRRLYWAREHKGLMLDVHSCEVCEEILNLLRTEEAELSIGEIAERLEMSHQRVGYHIAKMELEGVMERRTQGRRTLCSLREKRHLEAISKIIFQLT